MELTIYVHENLVIGLIKRKCGPDYGTIISELDCKDCGLYCSYNQQFDKCKNNWIIPVISVIISLMIIMMIKIIIMLTCKTKLNSFFLKTVWYFLTINDQSRQKRIMEQNKITGVKNNILFRTIVTSSDELINMIRESRLQIKKEVTGDEQYMKKYIKMSKMIIDSVLT